MSISDEAVEAAAKGIYERFSGREWGRANRIVQALTRAALRITMTTSEGK